MFKVILQKLITLSMFLLSCTCFYVAVNVSFSLPLANVLLFVTALFFLLQGCGRLDRAYGYGKYSGGTETNKDESESEDSKT
jgi:hypothetical protein